MNNTSNIPDTYYKKHISYSMQQHTFQFAVAHTIFSSFEIDKGSDLLLRTLLTHAPPIPPRTILDMGCGYGVLGIVLAHHYPQAQATLLDKDLLAVRYAQHNCTHNTIPNAHVVGSIGLEHVATTTYDLIVSNIPAKIGDAAIAHEFLLAPYAALQPGGVYWFVVVSGLNHLIPRIAATHYLPIKEVKKRSGHTVYRLQK